MSVLREIGIIARALDSIANIEFRDIELARGQYLYLVRIAENPGIIQEELSELLKVDRSTVARSVKKLEAKGLVQQKVAKDNKKNKEWFVTEKGEKLYPLSILKRYLCRASLRRKFKPWRKCWSECVKTSQVTGKPSKKDKKETIKIEEVEHESYS